MLAVSGGTLRLTVNAAAASGEVPPRTPSKAPKKTDDGEPPSQKKNDSNDVQFMSAQVKWLSAALRFSHPSLVVQARKLLTLSRKEIKDLREGKGSSGVVGIIGVDGKMLPPNTLPPTPGRPQTADPCVPSVAPPPSCCVPALKWMRSCIQVPQPGRLEAPLQDGHQGVRPVVSGLP